MNLKKTYTLLEFDRDGILRSFQGSVKAAEVIRRQLNAGRFGWNILLAPARMASYLRECIDVGESFAANNPGFRNSLERLSDCIDNAYRTDYGRKTPDGARLEVKPFQLVREDCSFYMRRISPHTGKTACYEMIKIVRCEMYGKFLHTVMHGLVDLSQHDYKTLSDCDDCAGGILVKRIYESGSFSWWMDAEAVISALYPSYDIADGTRDNSIYITEQFENIEDARVYVRSIVAGEILSPQRKEAHDQYNASLRHRHDASAQAEEVAI